jgi:hypothetical protein
MSEELEVLKIVTKRLEEAGIDYMISGSIAANYYTIPRMTRDIDIVIELKQENIDKFVSFFEDDFYINKETVINEVSRQGMFNAIYNRYVVKIDFIIKKSSEYQQNAFSRRSQFLIEQSPMWFISAEDLIISKLVWAKDSYSEMQLKDVRNLIETVVDLDIKYIKNWITRLDLEQIYKEVTQ